LSIVDRILGRGLRAARRFVVAVVGVSIVLFGLLLLVLPGPAFIVIPVGLAVLAFEFEWARRLLRRARDYWKPPNADEP
jgi:tellurite resistance protein TerC